MTQSQMSDTTQHLAITQRTEPGLESIYARKLKNNVSFVPTYYTAVHLTIRFRPNTFFMAAVNVAHLISCYTPFTR